MKILKMIQVLLCFSLTHNAGAQTLSAARKWNETFLQGVRGDFARPTVVARNLFHESIAIYDIWSLYDPLAKPYYINFKVKSATPEKDREIAIYYASYRILLARFAHAPKFKSLSDQALKLMQQAGLDPNNKDEDTTTPAGVGNTVASMILERFKYDGSNEENNYATPAQDFPPLNPPLMVKRPGTSGVLDVNLWQPLALDVIFDQNGNPIPGNVAPPLTLHWGRLPPYAMTDADKAPGKPFVYLDPGPPPAFGGVGHEDYVKAMEQLIEFSSWLDPRDGVTMDISPASIGNNTLGSNDGRGWTKNVVTGLAYPPQMVARGDYTRVLAEFWADGPNSETPPGHWNVIANYVMDQPGFKRRWMGLGSELPALEFEAKLYLTLNGALYDSAIAAWGLKGYYQGSRPISAIRYLSEIGQATSPDLPKYNPKGIHLKPGVIEMITPELTEPGQRFASLVGHEGEIAVLCWPGSPAQPGSEFSGVRWMLGTEWLPYQRPTFVTPPFPGYVSGHSTYSRAAAEVLTALTGSKFFPGGLGEFVAPKNAYLVFEQGPTETVKLQWATYYDAADQSARSRLFGGIHGYIDDFPGRRLGSHIGRIAVAHSNALFKN